MRFRQIAKCFTHHQKFSSMKDGKEASFESKSDESMAPRKRDIQANFIGPKAQNINYFKKLLIKAVDSHANMGVEFNPEDKVYISESMKQKKQFVEAQQKLEKQLDILLIKLSKYSVPRFLSRFFGHMAWETTISSNIGNIVGLLYNQNNVDFEGSPLTTPLQIQCINLLTKMVGFGLMAGSEEASKGNHKDLSWGHFTCGGTIANCQALWAARNNKFLAFTVRKYIENNEKCSELRNIKVRLVNQTEKQLLKLSRWQILNLSNEETINLYQRVFKLTYNITENQQNIQQSYRQYQKEVSRYSMGSMGFYHLFREISKIQDHQDDEIVPPKVLAPASHHYSIPKAVSLLGLGQHELELIPTDMNSRIDINLLRDKLQKCLKNRIPVLTLIGMLGSTSESAVDPLDEIIKLRKQFEEKGLYFHFHIDGAYGGYFSSMIRQKSKTHWNSISSHTENQLKMIQYADSITLDPHKAGYIPFAAGTIIYRNQYLKDQINFNAPYMFDGKSPYMSIYGIQGSKPGSTVVGAYLSHTVLPLNRSNHGELLERTIINSKIFQASLYHFQKRKHIYEDINDKGQKVPRQMKFKCLPFSKKYSQKYPNEKSEEQNQVYDLIARTKPQDMQRTIKGTKYEKIYLEMGSDINIVLYGVNFEGNRSLKQHNKFIKQISALTRPSAANQQIPKGLYLSETEIKKTNGKPFVSFMKRHNLIEDDDKIVLLRSTIMNAFFTEIQPDQDPNEKFLLELSKVVCRAFATFSKKQLNRE